MVLSILAALQGFTDSKVISVLYFENTTNNTDYAWFSKGAADMLISDLAAQPDFTVIERGQIQKILKEQEDSLSGLYDEKSAVQIGRLVAAKQIVIGSFIVHLKTLRIDAKVIDIETGKILKTVQAAGDLDNLFAVQKDLTAGVLRELGIQGALPGRADTESLEAARAYYTGIDFLDRGSFEQAAQSFRQAIKLDPFYAKPQRSLEDAYRFLKDFKRQRLQREIAKLYERAARFKARLDSTAWTTYAQFVNECYAKGLTAADIKRLTDADPTLTLCETRGQCTWELQMTLLEIASQAEENFEDAETAERMHRENLHIVEQARVKLLGDPFYWDVLYWEIFSLQYFEQWDKVMRACEHLMEKNPDYRMMWAIEDFYEKAIEKMGGKKKEDS